MKIIASEQAMRRWLGGAFLAVFVLSVVTRLPQLVVETDGAEKLLVAVADSACRSDWWRWQSFSIASPSACWRRFCTSS